MFKHSLKHILKHPCNTRKLKPKDDNNVLREIEVMRALGSHPNIIGLIESFETEETFHIVIDLARGGDLMRSISRRKRYCEFDGRALAREFIEAVNYIHSCNVVHRDLKPDNLLLDAADDDCHGLRIADFGFAKKVNRNGRLKSRCGTPAYVAPEICVGVEYGKGVDVWSCGVILYLLLSGKIPFTVKRKPGKKHDLKALFLKIRAADYVFEDQDWDMISMSAKQLIARMLTVDPKRRITLQDALKSPWMTKKDEDLGLSARVPLNNTITNLKQFNARRSLKSAMVAATFVTTANFWTPESVTFMSNNTTVGSTVFSAAATPAPSTAVVSSTAVSTKTLTSGKVGQKLENLYTLQDKIRDGEAGTVVRQGQRKGTNEIYAIKIINRGLGQGPMSANDNKVMNEVSILQSLSHNHVVKLHDFFEESTRFCLVMELMGGGDLFERIVTKEMYTENDAREVAKALVSAVDYIHKRGVAHRDLKPQNLCEFQFVHLFPPHLQNILSLTQFRTFASILFNKRLEQCWW